MNKPETQAAVGIRHGTKKNITQKAKKMSNTVFASSE
jgi:hypothetical protein